MKPIDLLFREINPPEKPILFFANAPVQYPYLVVTYKDVNKPKKLQKLFDREPTISIVDLGVYTYLVKSKEHRYPDELVDGMLKLVDETPSNVLVSSCDYPGLDFEHGIMIDYDNVRLTLSNWRKFMKTKNNDKVIYTVQLSTNDDLNQAIDDIEQFPDETPSNIIGVGSLCRAFRTNKQRKFVADVLDYVRSKYPSAWIHVWGAGITHVPTIIRYANSFDNSKWTRPVQTKTLPNWGAKNQDERVLFFKEYLRVINDKVRKYNSMHIAQKKLTECL